MAPNPNMIFRNARKEDVKAVRQMIQELADFEKLSDGPKLTEQDLIRYSGLDGTSTAICHIYILELQKADNSAPEPMGYAICYINFSTWVGQTYFLDDFYVRPEYRGIGAGGRIFREVAKKAKELGCIRFEFHVLAWNPARQFYAKMGAVDMTEAEERLYYRVHTPEMNKLVEELL